MFDQLALLGVLFFTLFCAVLLGVCIFQRPPTRSDPKPMERKHILSYYEIHETHPATDGISYPSRRSLPYISPFPIRQSSWFCTAQHRLKTIETGRDYSLSLATTAETWVRLTHGRAFIQEVGEWVKTNGLTQQSATCFSMNMRSLNDYDIFLSELARDMQLSFVLLRFWLGRVLLDGGTLVMCTFQACTGLQILWVRVSQALEVNNELLLSDENSETMMRDASFAIVDVNFPDWDFTCEGRI